MSLLKRVERAQQLAAQAAEQAAGVRCDAGPPSAMAAVPAVSEPPAKPAPVTPAPAAAVPPPVLTPTSRCATVLPGGSPPASALGRGLGGSVSAPWPCRSTAVSSGPCASASRTRSSAPSTRCSTYPDESPAGRGHRRPIVEPYDLRGDPRRTPAPRRRDDRRDHRPRPARSAPRRRDDHRGHGQRPAARLHRAGAARSTASTSPSSTTSTSSGSSTGSSPRSAGGSTSPARGSTPGCPTARASTPSSRRCRSSGRSSPSASSRPSRSRSTT